MFRGDAFTSHSYHYQSDGSIAEAVSFLALVELWQQEPVVRKLYRETPNEATVPSHVTESFVDAYLHYDVGEATAEDELIQKIRLHFGYGSRAALDLRASQNEVLREGIVFSASFWDGHTEVMRSRVCEALRDGKPGSLGTSEDGGNVVVTWDAPGYQADSVTGYQVLRSVNGAAPEVHVADTGTTDTAWTDENPPAGDLVYVVQAIYDDYYLGPASVRPNLRATGAPGIVGTAQVGSTLMADTSDIGDVDGLTTVSYSYQWISNDGTSDSDIANVVGSTYTPVVADGGKTIKVRVSFTDDAGSEESLTSAPTATVIAAVPGAPQSLVVQPSATGQLTASWQAPASDGGAEITGYTVQWKVATSSWDTAEDVSSAATTETSFTITSLSLGTEYSVRVITANSVGDGEASEEVIETAVALTSEQREAAQNNPATGMPTIKGTAQVGETLTADTSGISDEDGLDDATFAYQWVRSGGSDEEDIQDATGSTYNLTEDDQGKSIKVRVDFTDDAGSEESLTSAATAPVAVAAAPNSAATGQPQVVGSALVGASLSVDTSGIADADGLSGAQYRYQWLTSEDGANTEIAGATGSSYRLTWREDGKAIKVRVSFTDDAGYDESLTSPALHPVRVSGLAAQVSGETVVLSWEPPTGFALLFDYRILREAPELDENAPVVSTDTGNSATSYTDSDVEPGVLYRYRVQAANWWNQLSPASEAVEIRMPQAEPAANTPATGQPTISGTPQVGQTLTAGGTSIADQDGLDDAAYAYQWLADDVGIAGATAASYTLTSNEEGKAIKVRLSFTDDAGNGESLTSAATDAVASPPTPLTASIHDAPESHDGENSFTFELRFSETPVSDLSYKTLRDHAFTVTGGAVTNARRLDPPGNVRWEITVEPSSDADVTIVLPVTTDCDDQGAICTADGRMLSAEVTLTVAGPEEEEEQTPPENNPATGAPAISGTVQVGETLTADVTGIADEDGLDNVSYAYQWLADDADIAGATGATHTLTSSEQGKAIKVRVSFTDDGGNDESLTSARPMRWRPRRPL